jgi:hypothetical protein
LFFACEKENNVMTDESVGTIIFGKPLESGYETDGDLIKSWIIVNDVTYEAVYNNIDTLAYVEPNDTTFMEISFINSICIHAMEAVEILDTRVEDIFTYYKYKIKMPISYNDFDTAIYFVQERVEVTVNGTSYYLPVPFIETSLANDVRHARPDVYKNGKCYSCTLLDLSMGISCAEKTIVGKTSFHMLQEK